MTEQNDHAAHRILPANEPPPAPDTMISPAGLRIRELERERDEAQARITTLDGALSSACDAVVALQTENARLRRALDAAGIVRGCDPLLPQVAVEPWDVGDERDYGF